MTAGGGAIRRSVSTDSTIRSLAEGLDSCDLLALCDQKRRGDVTSATSGDLFPHCGFKKTLLEVVADAGHVIVEMRAIVDIYFIGLERPVSEKDAVKLGTVLYHGELVPGEMAGSEPKWNVRIQAISLFNKNNSASLPEICKTVGPGAFMSAVIQSLFGTKLGFKLLNLGDYTIPDVKAGTSTILY